MISDHLLMALDDSDVWRFISAQSPRAHVIAPEQVVQRFLQWPGFSYGTLADPIPPEKDVFVWDLDPTELAAARQFALDRPRVFGILHDGWAAAVAGAPDSGLGSHPAPAIRYAILCPPRSGSTHLCDLLFAAGLGNPREHLRPAFLQLYRAGYPFRDLMARMVERGARNGIFGTKVISTFLWAVGFSTVENYLKAHNFNIILLTRDPIEQAISGYFAHHTGIWHQYGDSSADYNAVPYDADAIREEYRQLVKANAVLVEFTERFSRVHRVSYPELDRAPRGVLRDIAALLGVEAPFAEPHVGEKKISARQPRMTEYRERFKQEITERPSRSTSPPDKATLRSLVESGKGAEAATMLQGIDLSAEHDPEFLYLAGVSFGTAGEEAVAIDLLKRAADNGFSRYWCAYNLGLLEQARGEPVAAAFYYVACLIARSGDKGIAELLRRIAPNITLSVLQSGEQDNANDA